MWEAIYNWIISAGSARVPPSYPIVLLHLAASVIIRSSSPRYRLLIHRIASPSPSQLIDTHHPTSARTHYHTVTNRACERNSIRRPYAQGPCVRGTTLLPLSLAKLEELLTLSLGLLLFPVRLHRPRLGGGLRPSLFRLPTSRLAMCLRFPSSVTDGPEDLRGIFSHCLLACWSFSFL